MITITTVEQLQAIADDMAGTYELGADIDLTGVDWIPLGTTKTQSSSSQTAFSGTLNGNGHSIKNLTITRNTSDTYNFVGLFGQLGACTIQNLVIKNANITVVGANPCIGILAGGVYSGTVNVSNVSVQGDMTISHTYKYNEYSYRGVGGMVGSIYNGTNTFTDCISTVNINISGCSNRSCKVAGFIGYGYKVTLTRCFAFGNITVTNTEDTAMSVSGMQSYCSTTTHNYCACAVNIMGVAAETVSECCKYLTTTSGFTNNESRRYWNETTIEWESYASDSDIALAEPDFVDLIGAEHIEKYNVDDMSFTEGKYIKLSIDTTGGYDFTIGDVTYYGVKLVIYNGVNIPELIVDGVVYNFGGGSTAGYTVTLLDRYATGNYQTEYISRAFTFNLVDGTSIEAEAPYHKDVVINNVVSMTYLYNEPIYISYRLPNGGARDLQFSETTERTFIIPDNIELFYANTPNCLWEGTPVTMADGSLKALGDIEVGDEVLSIDYDTMTLVGRKVIYSGRDEPDYDHWETPIYYENVFSDGTVIRQSMHHRFYNLEQQRYVYLHEWNIGEHTYSINGENPALVSRKLIQAPQRYARITLEGSNNWFANGLSTGDRHCPTDIILTEPLQ